MVGKSFDDLFPALLEESDLGLLITCALVIERALWGMPSYDDGPMQY